MTVRRPHCAAGGRAGRRALEDRAVESASPPVTRGRRPCPRPRRGRGPCAGAIRRSRERQRPHADRRHLQRRAADPRRELVGDLRPASAPAERVVEPAPVETASPTTSSSPSIFAAGTRPLRGATRAADRVAGGRRRPARRRRRRCWSTTSSAIRSWRAPSPRPRGRSRSVARNRGPASSTGKGPWPAPGPGRPPRRRRAGARPGARACRHRP